MKLLALIIAYAISHFIPKPQRFRNFDWLKSWSDWFQGQVKSKHADLILIAIIAVPVAILSLVLFNIFDSQLGNLVAAILVLSYCVGPESLDEEVESDSIRTKLGIRKNAKISVLIEKMTQVALRRWFGVFFWYVVLGIVGALIYRIAERMCYFTEEDSEIRLAIDKLMKILNYPVAWMMVVSLAIASDFERIFKKCKPYMKIKNIMTLDDSFLYEAADFAVENCEVEPESGKSVEQVTLSVLKRMLVVWLVVVALLVILAV